MTDTWDCIVVGGGAAGLSAGLVLGRARRRVLIVDAGEQSNRAAHAVQGALGHDGRTADDLYRLGREEIGRYPSAAVVDGEVLGGARLDGGGFRLELAGGAAHQARTVILATGMTYRYPQLPGAAKRWGGSVFHCPFCHGWEVSGRPLAVLASGDAGADLHRALLLTAWSDDVTLLAGGVASPASSAPHEASAAHASSAPGTSSTAGTSSTPGTSSAPGEPSGPGASSGTAQPAAAVVVTELDDAQRARLVDAGVRIEERAVEELVGPGRELTAVRLEDGEELACGGLLVPAPLARRSDLAAQLGAEDAAPSPLTAEAVGADPMGRTNVPGLFAAGDAAGRMPSVVNAIASGATAAAAVVGTLTGAL